MFGVSKVWSRALITSIIGLIFYMFYFSLKAFENKLWDNGINNTKNSNIISIPRWHILNV